MTVERSGVENSEQSRPPFAPEAHGSEGGSDETLLQRIAARDLDALDALYGRYGRTAFSVAYHVLNNAESAEDVVQEAFLTVWRRAESFCTERGSARTWLLSVVRHRAIDVARARAARTRGVPLDDVALVIAADDDPSSEALRRVEAAKVRAALTSLPVPQREVVELAFFAGLTYPEIAERVCIPLGTVKSRIRLALERLRGLLTTSQAHAPVIVEA